MGIQWVFTAKDLIELVLLLGGGLFFLWDRSALIKNHDKIIQAHEKSLEALDNSINTLTTALAALTAEFRMYKDMTTQFNPVRGRVEYPNGQTR